jgi:hypothetical protein
MLLALDATRHNTARKAVTSLGSERIGTAWRIRHCLRLSLCSRIRSLVFYSWYLGYSA